jgi:hypothetical protein
MPVGGCQYELGIGVAPDFGICRSGCAWAVVKLVLTVIFRPVESYQIWFGGVFCSLPPQA